MFRVLVLFSLAALTWGAAPQLDGRIVGGFDLDISDVPYQVSIEYMDQHVCGGALVLYQYVLTAGHCGDILTPETTTVRAGSTLLDTGGVLLNVIEILKHPQWNPVTLEYDGALLKLAQEIEVTPTVNIISLEFNMPPDGEMVLVTGWGVTAEGGELSNTLQGVNVPIYNQQKCADAYSQYNAVTDSMFCAGYEEGGMDSCQGDSGGPLTYIGRLVGIVSWGIGCARPASPGVYARVGAMQDWFGQVFGGKL